MPNNLAEDSTWLGTPASWTALQLCSSVVRIPIATCSSGHSIWTDAYLQIAAEPPRPRYSSRRLLETRRNPWQPSTPHR